MEEHMRDRIDAQQFKVELSSNDEEFYVYDVSR